MGVDWLDIRFRIERRYGVRFERDDFTHRPNIRTNDITAGELFAVVAEKLQASGRRVPASCWNGVRLEVGEALSVSPLTIRSGTLLIAELGMA